ncbi:MAG: twin-arginine translocase TatA/TatE family subunit [Nitrospiraceae bacterium]|nr:MAG: twin-arginine translocase TatA/TatE family subunit [Nitrospiraceae bacterium]
MFGLGMQELIIILIIVLVLFGARRLPELAGGIGKAIKNFKKSMSEPDEIDVTPKKDAPEEKKEEKKG